MPRLRQDGRRPRDQRQRGDGRTRFRQTLAWFCFRYTDHYLGKFEVTQEQWQTVMGSNPSWFTRTGKGKDLVKDISDEERKHFPVESLTWKRAQAFLEELNAREKEPGWVYRLPKEAEWEYACRGGPRADKFDYTFNFYFREPTNQLLPEAAKLTSARVGVPMSWRLIETKMDASFSCWCWWTTTTGLIGGSK